MERKQKVALRTRRARRSFVRTTESGRPRLVIYRSNKTIYAQIFQDGKVLCASSGLKSKATGIKMAIEVGKEIAKRAGEKKIKEVAFDRNGYSYHGQVKALADAAREAGLSF